MGEGSISLENLLFRRVNPLNFAIRLGEPKTDKRIFLGFREFNVPYVANDFYFRTFSTRDILVELVIQNAHSVLHSSN